MAKKALLSVIFALTTCDLLREMNNPLFPEAEEGSTEAPRGPRVHIVLNNKFQEDYVQTLLGYDISTEQAVELMGNVVIPNNDVQDRGADLKACKKSPDKYSYKLVRVQGSTDKEKWFTSLHATNREVAIG